MYTWIGGPILAVSQGLILQSGMCIPVVLNLLPVAVGLVQEGAVLLQLLGDERIPVVLKVVPGQLLQGLLKASQEGIYPLIQMIGPLASCSSMQTSTSALRMLLDRPERSITCFMVATGSSAGDFNDQWSSQSRTAC